MARDDVGRVDTTGFRYSRSVSNAADVAYQAALDAASTSYGGFVYLHFNYGFHNESTPALTKRRQTFSRSGRWHSSRRTSHDR